MILTLKTLKNGSYLVYSYIDKDVYTGDPSLKKYVDFHYTVDDKYTRDSYYGTFWVTPGQIKL